MLKGLAILSLLAIPVAALKNVTAPFLWGESGWTETGKWETWDQAGVNACTGGGSIRYTNVTGSSVTFTFTGVAIYLQATFGQDRGLVRIEVDGEFQNDVPSWYDGSEYAECWVLFGKSGLSNSEHTITATAQEPHNGSQKFELAAAVYTVVEPGDLEPPPDSESHSPSSDEQQTTKPSETSTNSLSSETDTHSSSQVLSANPSSPTRTPLESPSPPVPSGTRADILVTDPRIQWSPPDAWTNAGLDTSRSSCTMGTRVSYKTGAALTFPFKGNAISLAVVPSSSSGFFHIALDGQAIETRNGFTKDLTSSCSPLALYEKSGLPDTDHVLAVMAAGTSNSTEVNGTRLEIAGLIYYGADSASTSALLAPAPNKDGAIIGGGVGGALGALIIVAILVLIVRRRRTRQRKKTAAMWEINPYLRRIVFGPQSHSQSSGATPCLVVNTSVASSNLGSARGSPEFTPPPLVPGLLGPQITDSPHEPRMVLYKSPPPSYRTRDTASTVGLDDFIAT